MVWFDVCVCYMHTYTAYVLLHKSMSTPMSLFAADLVRRRQLGHLPAARPRVLHGVLGIGLAVGVGKVDGG